MYMAFEVGKALGMEAILPDRESCALVKLMLDLPSNFNRVESFKFHLRSD